MAKQGRKFKAKVEPEITNVEGYCTAKKKPLIVFLKQLN